MRGRLNFFFSGNFSPIKSKTVITREYPKSTGEPYYPINNEINNQRFGKYKKLKEKEENYIFGGRLCDYQYYDMHQVIASALVRSKKELG